MIVKTGCETDGALHITVHKPAAGGNICQSINFTLGRSFFTIHFIMYYVGILADGNV